MTINKRNFARMTASASVLALSMTGLLGSGIAAAQDDGAEADDNIIIVTAQKREQDILDVPVAVTALSAETLENTGVTEFSDLTRVAPSLTVTEGSNTNNSTVNLRGIGTYAFSIGVEPSVSVVVDDVAVVQQAQAFSNLSDIARIEVLRGPQGTLFGKNASAGVVNIVTKAPSDVFEADLEATFATDDEQKINASISGPLGDNLGVRINGYYVNRDGYINNLTDNSQLNGEESWGIRGKLAFESGDFTGQIILDHNERDSNGTAGTYLDIPAGAALVGFFPTALFTGGITPGPDNFNVRLDDNPVSNNKQTSGTLKLEYDFGGHVLTSISSYQDWGYTFDQDVDGSDFNLAGAFSMGALNGGIFQSGPFDANQFTQELRLTSVGSGDWEYMFGLFFSDAETERSFQRGPLFGANWNSTAGSKSYALFGQWTYNINDRTRLTSGARVNHEKIDVVFNELATNPAGLFQGEADDTAFTGKVSLQHDIADDVMVFGSFSSGYKGQGFDVSSGFTQLRADNPVREETSLSYEIGVKGRAFDNRVSFSATAFWTDYDDFQAQSARIVNNVVILDLNNVGKLRTKGIELEVFGEVADGFNLSASAAYVDAQIREFSAAQCYPGQTVAQGCVNNPVLGNIQDLAGSRLANAPEFSFTLGANYTTELPGTDFSAFFNANFAWQDDVNFDLFQNPRTVQDGYGIFNISLGLTDTDTGRWKLTGFVNNVFDKQYVVNIADASGLFGGTPVLTQILPRNARRYGGIRLKAGF